MRPEDKPIFEALTDEQAAVLTIYGEARGEPQEGKEAVACVIRNRAELWHKTVKEVCYQKGQFSCFIETDPNYHTLLDIATDFAGSLEVSKVLTLCSDAWTGDCLATSKKIDQATFYKRIDCHSPWFNKQILAGKLIETATIGHHDFFKEQA